MVNVRPRQCFSPRSLRLKMRPAVLPLVFLACVAASPTQKPPDCAGPDHWAAGMAFAKLKNAGVITSENVDFDHVSSKALLSARIGRDLWRQAFRVVFPLQSGTRIEAIVVSDASSEECSMSDAQVFLISKAL